MAKRPVDRARPTITDPDETVEEKIALTRKHHASMVQSEEWPSAPGVQEAAAVWSDETDRLEANRAKINRLLRKLKAARVREATILRRWMDKKQGVLVAVQNHCDGSKDRVRRFGFDVVMYGPRPLRSVPEGLHAKRSKIPGAAAVQWTTHRGEHNHFLVQHATGPDDPATYSEPVMVTKGTFVLEGQTPGQTIYFRVAAVEPKLPLHHTDYTGWVPVIVSA
jgi:hypothetical protein